MALIPPAFADLYAVIGIEVEKHRAKAMLLRPLLPLIQQPIAKPLGPGVVLATRLMKMEPKIAVAKLTSDKSTGAVRAQQIQSFGRQDDLLNAPH
jgi:hypothetical protein